MSKKYFTELLKRVKEIGEDLKSVKWFIVLIYIFLVVQVCLTVFEIDAIKNVKINVDNSKIYKNTYSVENLYWYKNEDVNYM